MRGKNHPGDVERQLDPDSTGVSVDTLEHSPTSFLSVNDRR